MTSTLRSHLSVVWDRDANSIETMPYQEPTQLSFQLDHNENLVLFVGETSLTGETLIDILYNLQPSFLLDLRACPRFDFPGYSRKRAFLDFDHFGTKYFDLDSDDILLETNLLHEKLHRTSTELTGPLVVFVEGTSDIDQFSKAIPTPGTPAGKWTFALTGL